MLVLCVPMEIRHSPLSRLSKNLSTLTHNGEKKKNGKNAKQLHTAHSILFVLDLVKGKQIFDTENNRDLIMMLKCYFPLNNVEIFLLLLLLSASRSLCIWSKQQLSHVGGAPKAKQVKVEIKAKDKGFFGNKRSLSLDFSSQDFARAKTTRGRLVSARVCPQIAQTHTSLKV